MLWDVWEDEPLCSGFDVGSIFKVIVFDHYLYQMFASFMYFIIIITTGLLYLI